MVCGIDYGGMMYWVMQWLIVDVLEVVVQEGLLGEYYFFIIFDICDLDVEMVDWL